MRRYKIGVFSVMAAFAAMAVTATAGTKTVYYTLPDGEPDDGMTPVQRLTNAIATAVNGDVIRIMPGTYTFNDEYMGIVDSGNCSGTNLLSVTKNNIMIEGYIEDENNVSRTNWIDHAEPVIIDGNGKGRIIYVTSGNAVTVRNIAFTGGYCYHETANSYGGVACRAGGSADVTFTNCVLRQNKAKNGGGALYSLVLRDCLVTNNLAVSAVQACTVYGCDFIGNEVRCVENSTSYDCLFTANGSGSVEYPVGGTKMSNCVIRANMAPSGKGICGNGGTYTDCVFEDNQGKPIANSWQGEYCPTVRRCQFRRNQGLSLLNPKLVDHCVFEDNSGGAIEISTQQGGFCSYILDSQFRRNWRGNYANGGAIYANLRYDAPDTFLGTVLVSNCVFESNVATNGGGNIGGAICNKQDKSPDGWKFPSDLMTSDYFTVMDSEFTSNIAASAGGVYGVKAVRCKFDGNAMVNNSWVSRDAWRSVLVDCDLNGGGLVDCILDRCVVHDAKGVNNLFESYIRATNSLISRCSSTKMYGVRDATNAGSSYTNKVMDAEFVGCTFVENISPTYGISSKAINATNGLKFADCIFWGNSNLWYVTDFDSYKDGDNYNPYWDKVSIENSSYKTLSVQHIPEFVCPETFFQCQDPKFVGLNPKVAARYPDEPYWALSYNSPLLGRGDASIFSAEDVDLAWRPRLNEGKVDLGCYQCWLVPPGMMMILR